MKSYTYLFFCLLIEASCTKGTSNDRIYSAPPLVTPQMQANAAAFSQKIPGLQGEYVTDSSIVFVYAVNDPLPLDSAQYREDNTDAYALEAHDAIFTDICSSHIEITFTTVFLIYPVGAITFNYPSNDPLFNG